jgi:hypothetical protein
MGADRTDRGDDRQLGGCVLQFRSPRRIVVAREAILARAIWTSLRRQTGDPGLAAVLVGLRQLREQETV